MSFFTRRIAIGFCFLLAVLIVGRLCYWSEPYGVSVDESTYMALAEILQSGGVAYIDAVDRKPPGLFWLYAGIGHFFGPWNIHAVHFIFFGMTVLLAGLAAYVAGRLFGRQDRRRMFTAALFFAVYSGCFPREIVSSNAEYPMLVFSVFSFVCFFRAVSASSKKALWFLAAAVLAAIATLFKQYAVLIYVSVYSVWMIDDFVRSSDKIKALQKQVAVFFWSMFGFCLVYGMTAFYFYSQNGLNEFLDYSFLNGLKYVATSRQITNHDTSGLAATFGMIVSWPLLWFGLSRLRRKEMSLPIKLTLAAAFGSLVTIYLSGRYYTHYFVPVIWFLSVLSAGPLHDLWNRAAFKARTALLTALFLPFLVYAVFNYGRDWFSNGWSFTKERQHQMQEAAQFIKDSLRPEERIIVWGMASQFYVMSERGSSSRFVFADFPSGRLPGYKSAISQPIPGTFEIFMNDLKDRQPKVFVDTSPAGLNDYGNFPISRFPELERHIHDRYEKAATIHGFDIWFLKPALP